MPAKRGAGRPKFKKPTLESFYQAQVDKRAETVLKELEAAFAKVQAVKGSRTAQLILDAFFINNVRKLPVKHYSSFLRVCKDKLK